MTDTNTRRNQIIARHVAERTRSSVILAGEPDAKLWAMVHDAIEQAASSAMFAGKTDRTRELVTASLALDELHRRGTQLVLFPNA